MPSTSEWNERDRKLCDRRCPGAIHLGSTTARMSSQKFRAAVLLVSSQPRLLASILAIAIIAFIAGTAGVAAEMEQAERSRLQASFAVAIAEFDSIDLRREGAGATMNETCVGAGDAGDELERGLVAGIEARLPSSTIDVASRAVASVTELNVISTGALPRPAVEVDAPLHLLTAAVDRARASVSEAEASVDAYAAAQEECREAVRSVEAAVAMMAGEAGNVTRNILATSPLADAALKTQAELAVTALTDPASSESFALWLGAISAVEGSQSANAAAEAARQAAVEAAGRAAETEDEVSWWGPNHPCGTGFFCQIKAPVPTFPPPPVGPPPGAMPTPPPPPAEYVPSD